MTVTRFCILASQRTGSNYLVGALNSHPEIVCHYELFHPHAVYSYRPFLACVDEKERAQLLDREMRDRDPIAFLERVMQQSASHFPEAKCIGFKLFTTHNQLVWKEILTSDVVKIFLYRENKLDQYASDKIATTTGIYASHDPQPTTPVKVDFDFQEFITFIETTSGSLHDDLKKIQHEATPHLVIEYEEIETLQFAPILERLGVNPHLPCYSALKKQNSRKTSDKFKNFDYLVSTLRGTPYEKWIVR